MTLTSSYQYIGRTDGVKCSAGWIYYVLLYAKTTGSIATGKHTVTMLMRLVCDRNATFKGFATTGSATVDGAAAISWANQSNPSADWPSGSITEGGYTYQRWTDLAEGSVEVNTGYGVDKNVTLAVSWQRLARSTTPPTYVPGTSVISGAFTVTLPMIAGASTPTLSASTVEMGKPVTIYTNRLSAGFTHTLTYWFGNAKATFATGVGGSYAWTPPLELAKQTPSHPSGEGTIICTTEQIGSDTSVGITLTVPNNANTQPSVSMTLSPVSSLKAPFNALYIQGLTKVDADLSATGKYGATIKSYQMVVGGSAYGAPYTSGYLTQSGNVTVTGKATDSRGIVGTTQKTISVIPYTKPTVGPVKGQADVVCARCDEDGNFTDSGTYLRIIAKRSYSPVASGGVQYNFCKIQYRCEGGSWREILARDASGDEVDTGAIDGVVSSTTTSYTIEIRVEDDIGNTHSVTKTVPTEQVDFHLRKGGKGAAFGEYSEEENVLSVAADWTSKFKGQVQFGDKVTGIPAPENDSDAVPKFYVDGVYAAEASFTMGGYTVPVYFVKCGKVVVATISYQATTTAVAENSHVSVAIPAGFRPCGPLQTGLNSTAALWARGWYTPTLIGALSVTGSALNIYFSIGENGSGFTYGATMTWITD